MTRRAPRLVKLALGVALAFHAGCGGAAYVREAEPELDVARDQSPAPLLEEQASLDEELATALALTQVDCGRACQLSGRICDLAGRVCSIASRHPSDAELTSGCEGAQQRCDGGRERVRQRCACDAP
ncbi:MAG: hypothetical protein IT378_25890 [Sandaracinaceae bacterium]|nr:hypothetical protein [Sandaracinaceae bacterium]